MEYRKLGNSGLKVSVVGLGCNNFGMKCDAEQTRAVVHRALDEGITLFDTADIYGNRGQSEEMLGKALENRRHEILIASKFGMSVAAASKHLRLDRAQVSKSVAVFGLYAPASRAFENAVHALAIPRGAESRGQRAFPRREP